MQVLISVRQNGDLSLNFLLLKRLWSLMDCYLFSFHQFWVKNPRLYWTHKLSILWQDFWLKNAGFAFYRLFTVGCMELLCLSLLFFLIFLCLFWDLVDKEMSWRNKGSPVAELVTWVWENFGLRANLSNSNFGCT